MVGFAGSWWRRGARRTGGFGRRDFQGWRCDRGGGRGVRYGLALFAIDQSNIRLVV